MTAIEYRIPYKCGQVFNIKPLFDIHLGNTDCDVRAFRNMINSCDENTYFIGGGDMIDAIVTKDVKRYRKSGDDSDGDAIIDEQIELTTDILSSVKERIIGLGCGNHEDIIKVRCATDPIKRICKNLTTDKHKISLLGYSSFIKLVFSMNGGAGRTLVIKTHHGYGGGSRTRGADITKFEKDMAKWDADVYLYGHVHKLQFDRFPRLGLKGITIVDRPQLLCICGTYLKTCSSTIDPTYAEIKGYPPCEIGGLMIKVKPDTRKWLDLSVEI